MTRNGQLKKTLVWLIVACPLSWTSGCYTSREYTKLEDVPKPPIEVVTKGNKSYSFESGWKNDGSGGISGLASWAGVEYPWSTDERVLHQITVPRDSIRNITAEEGNEIVVATKDSKTYFFSRWSVDSSGGLFGIGGTANPFFMMGDLSQPKYYHETHLRIPADSIDTITGSEFSTALTVLGVSVAIAVVVVTKLWMYIVYGPVALVQALSH